MSELSDAIADALRATWEELARTGRHFYGFALYTGPACEYISGTAFSEEGLDEIARDEASRSQLRWSPVDSPHHLAGETHFARVEEMLARRGDVDDMDEDDQDDEVDARIEACFEALARVDREGLFGAGRDAIVLNILQGDQSDRSRRDNAARLNPAAVAERFAADLDIREPSGAHVTLGDSAYQINSLQHRDGILAASGSGGELFVWRDEVELHAAHTRGRHWALALGRDRLYVSDGNDVLVHAIGADSLSSPLRFASAAEQVRALAVAPDGTVACSSWDGLLTAWREDGSAAWQRAEDVIDLAYGPSGLLAIAGERGVSFVTDGTIAGKLPRASAVRALAWSADEGKLATATRGSIQLWQRHASGWKRTGVLPGRSAAEATAIAFSPDAARIASSHQGGALCVWSPDGDSPLVMHGRQESMLAVTWLDDRRVACAGRDVDRGPPVYVFETG
jgi:Domain of unknown function (DUF4303)